MKKSSQQLEIDGLEADLLYYEDRKHTATTVEEYCEVKAMIEIVKDRIEFILSTKQDEL